jgi:UDPglucose 6-dehydrogenase
MRITMMGTGYVGLVTGACFAEAGNDVVCVDIDPDKVARLQRGEIPIYEPGLQELVERNAARGRLRFTSQAAEAVRRAELVFLAVGTPQADDGSADLTFLWRAVDDLAEWLDPQAIVVIKSTVPVGTNARTAARLRERTGRPVDVASNPEFLREGSALADFLRPDRVVVGVRQAAVADKLRELYRPFLRVEQPFLVMSPESAEMTKYVANALLATKISFINEMANLCQRLGGDINDVRRGIGHDARIGFAFLFPGLGYGGSCFPKDVRALQRMAEQQGIVPRMLKAVDEVNQQQKLVLLSRIVEELGDDLRGRRFAMWGVAFKPQTDDVREAPAAAVATALLQRGAALAVHDPQALANFARQFPGQAPIAYCSDPLQALDGADALVICTEWKEYQNPDFAEIRRRLTRPLIFDGRNLYEPDTLRQHGFVYHSIGRATVRPER